MKEIGKKVWVVPEGYIPAESTGGSREMESHDSISILNAGDEDARVEITLFFTDKEPVGPYKVAVKARRSKHVRFNELDDPEPMPLGTEYSSVIDSDKPIVVQYTRLDSRQAENALLSVMAFPAM